MAENLILGLILVRLAQICPFPPNFLRELPVLVVRHCSKLSFWAFKLKLMNQTWNNGGKPNFGLNFGPFGPYLHPSPSQKKYIYILWVLAPLVVRYCSNPSSYTVERKNNEPNLRKWQKSLCLSQFWALRSFFMDFTSTRCYTLSQAIIVWNFKENVWSKLEKMAKNVVLGRFWP